MSKNLIWLNVGGEKFCTRKRLEKSIIWYHEKHKNYILDVNIGFFPIFMEKDKLETQISLKHRY